MGYISSPEHFFNYLRKSKEAAGIDDTYSPEFFTQYVYNRGLADAFCWAVKQEPKTLYKRFTLQWLRWNSGCPIFQDRLFEHRYTAEFISVVDGIRDVPGVYGFFSGDELSLYVGTSIKLGERIEASFVERFQNFDEEVWLRYIVTKTRSDASILEIMYINLLKPSLNGAGKHDDNITLKLPNLPEWGPATLCNRIVS